jgi:IS30 family transposase
MAKHLNKDDMKYIERGLDKNIALTEMAENLERDSRGISRHIKKYRIVKVDKRWANKCSHKYVCKKKHLCDSCLN